MTFPLLFTLLLIASVLSFLRASGLSRLFLVLSLLFSWAVGSGLVARPLLAGLQREPIAKPEWKSRNAIIVVGAGTDLWPDNQVRTSTLGFSRIYEAARLYFDCKRGPRTCVVFTSGGDPLKNGQSEAEVMKDELDQIGVRAQDLRVEPKSNTTFQNARFTATLLKTENFDKTVLVTSGVHLARALLNFSHFGIHADGAPSDRLAAPASAIPIAYNFALADFALHEYAGIARKWVYDSFGWNAENGTPGTP